MNCGLNNINVWGLASGGQKAKIKVFLLRAAREGSAPVLSLWFIAGVPPVFSQYPSSVCVFLLFIRPPSWGPLNRLYLQGPSEVLGLGLQHVNGIGGHMIQPMPLISSFLIFVSSPLITPKPPIHLREVVNLWGCYNFQEYLHSLKVLNFNKTDGRQHQVGYIWGYLVYN